MDTTGDARPPLLVHEVPFVLGAYAESILPDTRSWLSSYSIEPQPQILLSISNRFHPVHYPIPVSLTVGTLAVFAALRLVQTHNRWNHDRRFCGAHSGGVAPGDAIRVLNSTPGSSIPENYTLQAVSKAMDGPEEIDVWGLSWRGGWY